MDVTQWLRNTESSSARYAAPNASTSAPLPSFTNTQHDVTAEIYQRHAFHPNLLSLDEMDRISIAFVFEAYDTIKDEVNVAQKQYHQMALVTRTYELRFQKAQKRLEEARRKHDSLYGVALRDVSTHSAQPSESPRFSPYSKSIVFFSISLLLKSCCREALNVKLEGQQGCLISRRWERKVSEISTEISLEAYHFHFHFWLCFLS